MALECSELKKIYSGQETYALGAPEEGVSLDVKKGELFALLGPSGCGKTTTLRIIGGFVEPTSGVVRINGKDVTSAAPYARPTNTVFQSYALFPHMNVSSNVEFGLKMEKTGREERRKRVEQALALVGLEQMAGRKVSELSGGQQQRAALARAIVKQPAVLLLDEPLGALDLRLRRQMQSELVALKRETGTTFVHVTHDQEEACAIADRIAVMRDGHVVQVDSPLALYRAPKTAYVATFIDAGTLFRGTSRRSAKNVELEDGDVMVKTPVRADIAADAPVAALLPRDCIRLVPSKTGGSVEGSNRASGKIESAVFTGSQFDVLVSTSGGRSIRAAMSTDRLNGDIDTYRPGAKVDLTWNAKDVVIVEDDVPVPAETSA